MVQSFKITAGPESLEDYFQKGTLLGQKAALNIWFVDMIPGQIRKNCYLAFESLSYLVYIDLIFTLQNKMVLYSQIFWGNGHILLFILLF